jgi:cell division protein ZapA
VTQLHVVNVTIAGEEYAIRTHASPDYTRECAEHVDRIVSQVVSAGALIQAHKAGILAALAVTDELFQARRDVEELRAQIERLASRLASEIEGHLGANDLAGRS